MQNDYEFLDCGNFRRLERFGNFLIDRPCPAAFWMRNEKLFAWNEANVYYERGEQGIGVWKKPQDMPETWNIELSDLNFELKLASNSQVGIFPEQLNNWQWIAQKLKNRNRPAKILNAFAYTGGSTIAAKMANPEMVEVCHLDASKPAINWAKKNMELSGGDVSDIRWIMDDVIKFLTREVKRGKKYDGFVLDPPAFGRGKTGNWKIERDLPVMMGLVNQLLSNDPCFVALSCHDEVITKKQLSKYLKELTVFEGREVEMLDLIIPASQGHDLPSSICARVG